MRLFSGKSWLGMSSQNIMNQGFDLKIQIEKFMEMLLVSAVE